MVGAAIRGRERRYGDAIPPAELRRTFDEVAGLYERVRPRYPEALHDDLVALAGLRPGDRVLEIGCGTGQASVPLAERGLELTCVELGARLAEVARRRLAAFPSARVVVAPFEAWEPPAELRFDAVAAFTAFHWLDPEIRYAKPARLLRPGAALAVAMTHHVLPADGDAFFADVQEDYDAVVPDPANRAPPPPEEVAGLAGELRASGLFEPLAERRYPVEIRYDAQGYLDLLDSYSGHRSMEPERRRRLYERIGRRIEARPGGLVTKSYLFTLDVARRR